MLYRKVIGSADKLVFLTHPLLPLGKRAEPFYTRQIQELGGKYGRVIAIDDPEGYYKTDKNNTVIFQKSARKNKTDQQYIFRRLFSTDGRIQPEKILPDILGKQLYFAGGNLSRCLFKTILSVLPAAAETEKSAAFTLLKDNIWLSREKNPFDISGYLKEQHKLSLRYADFNISGYDPVPALTGAMQEVLYALGYNKMLNRLGMNLFFHYNDQTYALYRRQQHRLSANLIVE